MKKIAGAIWILASCAAAPFLPLPWRIAMIVASGVTLGLAEEILSSRWLRRTFLCRRGSACAEAMISGTNAPAGSFAQIVWECPRCRTPYRRNYLFGNDGTITPLDRERLHEFEAPMPVLTGQQHDEGDEE